MIYPDEEKITYSYNLGGQLEKVHGYKSYGYDYVSKIGYDKFEQRTYLKYCNGAETFYTYAPQRRRLQNLTVNSGGNAIMDNAYTYDAVSNVLSVVNGASVPQSGKAGGQMAHTILTLTVAKARNISTKLTHAGAVLIGADILLSGEIKPSHLINGAMLGVSTTGVGTIIAGVWFIADYGTMGINYIFTGEAKGISDIYLI